MTLPTAGLSFPKPTGYVMPLVRAALSSARSGQLDDRPRGECPETAILIDCHRQFAHEGLQRLALDLVMTCGEAVCMYSESSGLTPQKLLDGYTRAASVEEAPKPGDVLWSYMPAIVRSRFDPDSKPGIGEILLKIDRDHGFQGSMDFLIALAHFTSAIVCNLEAMTSRPTQEILRVLKRRMEPHWAGLDRFDDHVYAS